jgi:hypothetical protein
LVLLLEEDDLDGRIRYVELLGSCLPSGKKCDVRGASFRQVRYIARLAGFQEAQVREFCRVVNEAGGLDSTQAHHLINELKKGT